jgi:hypothetical protein
MSNLIGDALAPVSARLHVLEEMLAEDIAKWKADKAAAAKNPPDPDAPPADLPVVETPAEG